MTDWKPNPLIDDYRIRRTYPTEQYPSVKDRFYFTPLNGKRAVVSNELPAGARAVKSEVVAIVYHYINCFYIVPMNDKVECIIEKELTGPKATKRDVNE